MATSKIILYETNITPERNARVDALETYLSTAPQEVIENFQYKTIKLDDIIRINKAQEHTPNFQYNYLSVKREGDSKIYYYFILNTEWKSANTIELQISLDTINTFWNELVWTDRTVITRRHKDRFLQTTVTTGFTSLKRVIDKYDEGISPTKTVFYKDKITLTDADYNFYLIYKNKDDTSANTNTPINCFCVSDYGFQMNIAAAENGINVSDLQEDENVFVLANDNEDFTATITSASGTTTHTIGKNQTYKAVEIVKRSGSGFAYFITSDSVTPISGVTGNQLTGISGRRICHKYSDFDYTPTNYVTLLGDLQIQGDSYDFYIGTGGGQLNTIDSINRTDTRIIKIIKMPYAPFEISFTNSKLNVPTGWIFSNGLLRLENLDTEFLCKIKNDYLDDLSLTLNYDVDLANDIENNIEYESKLYNSNFWSRKYYYDNFEKELLLERYTPTDTTDRIYIDIKFKQSNNISSSSLFDFKMINARYDEPTLYSEYLNVNRQNELALYTSDYLNYIRSGYNYDKKTKTLQTTSNVLGLATSIVGAAVSMASSAATGGAGIAAGISFATSAVASLTNTISSAVQSEESMAQKLDQLKRQASSVSNTEDLNLLSYYNGNRLIKTTEKCSDAVQQAIYNLFRLTGYACNDYGVPNFTSRCYYNFVQCSPNFDELSWTYGQNFLNDIKARFQTGVTVYHYFRGKYDWNQEKENFETWLVSNQT